MDFPLYFQILRGRVWGFVFKLGSYFFFCKMACIYLLNSRWGPQSLDLVITTYSHPLVILKPTSQILKYVKGYFSL